MGECCNAQARTAWIVCIVCATAAAVLAIVGALLRDLHGHGEAAHLLLILSCFPCFIAILALLAALFGRVQGYERLV
jgi:hypothetical protein